MHPKYLCSDCRVYLRIGVRVYDTTCQLKKDEWLGTGFAAQENFLIDQDSSLFPVLSA